MSPYVEGKNAEKHFPERQRVKRFNTLPASRSSKGTLSLQYSLSYNRIGTEVASFEEGIFLTKTRIWEEICRIVCKKKEFALLWLAEGGDPLNY